MYTKSDKELAAKMTDVEEIINELSESGVDLFEMPLDKIKAASVCDDNGNRIIGVDIKKFDCSAEIKTALLHEQGHCETYSFYNEYTPKLIRSKLERRADRYVAENKITKQDIIKAHEREGLAEVWEFAEHFNVTVEYMKRLMNIHFDMEFMG
jgi:hypothetical protein